MWLLPNEIKLDEINVLTHFTCILNPLYFFLTWFKSSLQMCAKFKQMLKSNKVRAQRKKLRKHLSCQQDSCRLTGRLSSTFTDPAQWKRTTARANAWRQCLCIAEGCFCRWKLKWMTQKHPLESELRPFQRLPLSKWLDLLLCSVFATIYFIYSSNLFQVKLIDLQLN